MTEVNIPETKWRIRRIYLFVITMFCMAVLGVSLWASIERDLDGTLPVTMASFSFITIMACVGSYVFGVAWQDISKFKLIGK